MENFTENLPLQIRVAMARQWMTGVALEVSLRVNNSPEELPEALRKPLDLITEDMADCALAALMTLETDMKNHLLWEVSHQCLCRSVIGFQTNPHSPTDTLSQNYPTKKEVFSFTFIYKFKHTN